MTVSAAAWHLAGATAAHQLACLNEKRAVAADGEPTVMPLLLVLKDGDVQLVRLLVTGDVAVAASRVVAERSRPRGRRRSTGGSSTRTARPTRWW